MKNGAKTLPPHVADILKTATSGVLGTEHNVVSREFSVDCNSLPDIAIKLDNDSKHHEAIVGSSVTIVLRPSVWQKADRYAFVEGVVKENNNFFIFTAKKITVREKGAMVEVYDTSHKAASTAE